VNHRTGQGSKERRRVRRLEEAQKNIRKRKGNIIIIIYENIIK